MATGAGAIDAADSHAVAGVSSIGTGQARCSCRQAAAVRRTADTFAGWYPTAHGTRSSTAMARRLRRGASACRGFRSLPLPAASRDSVVLAAAVQDGLGLLLWRNESFAYADSFDEATGRYRGLRCGQRVDVFHDASEGLVVKPDVAAKQHDAGQAAAGGPASTTSAPEHPTNGKPQAPGGDAGGGAGVAGSTKPRRYHGTVVLDAARVGRDAGRIADEVIAHLSGLVGSSITVTSEIAAEVPGGVPDNVSCERSLKTVGH